MGRTCARRIGRRSAVAAGIGAFLLLGMAAGGWADPRIKTTGEADATGDLFKEYSGQKKALGFVPNDVEIMSQDLALMQIHEAFGQGLLDTERHLTSVRKAMVGLVVGAATSNDYLQKLEGWQLERLGTKSDQVTRIAQDFQSAGLQSADVTGLKYVKKLATSPADIAEQDFADLRWDGWTDPEILELTMVASYFVYLGRITQALGVVPDTYPDVTR